MRITPVILVILLVGFFAYQQSKTPTPAENKKAQEDSAAPPAGSGDKSTLDTISTIVAGVLSVAKQFTQQTPSTNAPAPTS